MAEPMMTRNEIAAELNVHLSTVGNLITSGTLYAVKIGSVWRVPRAALDAYISGEPSPFVKAADPLGQDDVTSWPPTPSMLARLDGTDPDPQATDDAVALDVARTVLDEGITG